MTSAVGFVVAGGRSRRMGRDKALLPWANGTLLDHALARVRAVCPDTRILSGREVRYSDRGVPVHPDLVPDAGPLAGLHAGLSSLSDGERGLFLAVDMPYVPVDLLQALLELSRGHDAAVPVLDGTPEPLCAVYSQDCLAAVAERVAAGDLKMTSFWPSVRVKTCGADEVGRFGDPRQLLRSLNRPEDYEAACVPGRRV